MKPTQETFERAIRLASHFIALDEDPKYHEAHSLYLQVCREVAALPFDAPAETKERLCRSMMEAYNRRQEVTTRCSRLYLEKRPAVD